MESERDASTAPDGSAMGVSFFMGVSLLKGFRPGVEAESELLPSWLEACHFSSSFSIFGSEGFVSSASSSRVRSRISRQWPTRAALTTSTASS